MTKALIQWTYDQCDCVSDIAKAQAEVDGVSGLCLFIGALAGARGLKVIVVADETFMSVFHRLGEAWFLHLPALKRRQILGLPGKVLKMLPEDVVACLGTKGLVGVCTVCCHVTWLAACIAGDRGCCTTCEALSPHVMVDRVPCYTRGPAGKITKGSIVF